MKRRAWCPVSGIPTNSSRRTASRSGMVVARIGAAAALLTMACGAGRAAGKNATWVPANTGIPTARFGVKWLTVDPAVPSTLYAVTSLGSISKSTDSAASWHPAPGVGGVTSLSIDPQDTATLYATAYDTGIFKSIDGGVTWSAINNGFTGGASLLAVDPLTPSTLYSATYGPSGNVLFKSTDAGQTWTPVTSLQPSNTYVECLAIDPVTPSTLYAALGSGEIFKSTDGGGTWTSVMAAKGAGFAFVPLVIDPRTPSTLYAGSFAAFQGLTSPVPFDDGTGTISKSTDGGQTWTVLRTGIPSGVFVESLAIDPAGSGTVYGTYESANDSGILKSPDDGQSWAVAHSFSQTSASSVVAFAAGSSPAVYAGHSNNGPGGILRSADGGANWTAADAGLDYIDLRTLGFHSGAVYTAGAGGVFRTADNGATWNALGGTFQVVPQGGGFFTDPFGVGAGIVRSLLIDPSNANNLYAVAARTNGCDYDEDLVFKSVDGGASWNSAISPSDSGCLVSGLLGTSGGMMAIDPLNPSVLYLQETDSEDGIFTLLKSTDGGNTWNTLWDAASGVNALLIDPANSGNLYAGLDSGAFCKSTDDGANWVCAALGTGTVTALAMDPANSRVLYAATTVGLFKSADGGGDWTPLSTGPAAVTPLAIAPGVLYAATSQNGIYRSTDGGDHWVGLSSGLTSLNVRALVFATGSPDILYAATASGIFELVGDPPQARTGKP